MGRRNSGPSAGAAAYSGLSPSASNCRLHSVGGSRSRSTPMPRGRRPSIAALTRLGARKASEMVILTCRTLHFSRVQSSAIVVIRPETTSSSHRRPRAIALTRRARRSNCSGRTSLRDALCGSRIWRDLLEGGFCQGIESDRCAWDEHRGFGFIKPDDGGARTFSCTPKASSVPACFSRASKWNSNRCSIRCAENTGLVAFGVI